MNYFHDILKVNDPEKEKGSRFSLARTLLLISVMMYFIAILLTFISAFIEIIVDKEAFQVGIDALKWTVLTFSAYALGGKIISHQKNQQLK